MDLLAYADGTDKTYSNMTFVLACIASVGVIAVLTRVAMLLARRNAHPRAAEIELLAIVWGILALGSAIYAIVRQWNWDKQYMQDLLSGYGDPHEAGPGYPWNWWGVLAVIYLLLVGWGSLKKK
jgi:hypothetical protein